jgi:hypothetical protein
MSDVVKTVSGTAVAFPTEQELSASPRIEALGEGGTA